jgi:23S rRNA (cytosine1962-C5)-methyltransferase
MKWARRRGLTAFRVYDRDMPEYPFVVEWYAGHVQVVEYARRRAPAEGASRVDDDARRREVIHATLEVLGVPASHLVVKSRSPKAWRREQYELLATTRERIVVEEDGLRFLVNLHDRIDTGLFLDHRNTRARVREEATGKRFLNLFCYTGAFTVHAAAGGAVATTSVDLSNTYLAWLEENLALNGLASPRHELVRSDVTRWLSQSRGREFDLVVLDPPAYSVSKKMVQSFEVQRDHVRLIRDTLGLIAPGGTLYFSTSFRGFRLDPAAVENTTSRELTPASLPEDIRDRKAHRCWRITR